MIILPNAEKHTVVRIEGLVTAAGFRSAEHRVQQFGVLRRGLNPLDAKRWLTISRRTSALRMILARGARRSIGMFEAADTILHLPTLAFELLDFLAMGVVISTGAIIQGWKLDATGSGSSKCAAEKSSPPTTQMASAPRAFSFPTSRKFIPTWHTTEQLITRVTARPQHPGNKFE